MQLSLHFSAPTPIARIADREPANGVSVPGRLSDIRVASMDQRLSTREVVLIVGVNRSTIFRWVKAGRFPAKHHSGGWIRSEVQRWLTEHATDDDFTE